MKNKDVTILRHLIEHKNEKFNIRNISKSAKMDYKNTHAIVKRLENESLVKLEQFGQSLRVELIPQSHPLIFEAEWNRRKDALKTKNLAVILNDIKTAIKSKFFIILLFGSYAKNTQTKHSDIDLMIIAPDGKEETIEKDVHRAVRSLPLPIHHMVFSEKQFREMIDAKQPNVGQEASQKNVILYGIDQYYEMTK